MIEVIMIDTLLIYEGLEWMQGEVRDDNIEQGYPKEDDGKIRDFYQVV